MAVAKEQISELWEVVKDYIEKPHRGFFIDDLRCTDAYKTNESFRDTINLLKDQLKSGEYEENE